MLGSCYSHFTIRSVIQYHTQVVVYLPPYVSQWIHLPILFLQASQYVSSNCWLRVRHFKIIHLPTHSTGVSINELVHDRGVIGLGWNTQYFNFFTRSLHKRREIISAPYNALFSTSWMNLFPRSMTTLSPSFSGPIFSKYMKELHLVSLGPYLPFQYWGNLQVCQWWQYWGPKFRRWCITTSGPPGVLWGILPIPLSCRLTVYNHQIIP